LPQLTWPKGHPPVIFICLLFQWLQVVTKLYQANFADEDIVRYADSTSIDSATLLSLTAIIILSLGCRFFLSKCNDINILDQREQNTLFSEKKLFIFFLASLGISTIIDIITRFIPGLSQITLS